MKRKSKLLWLGVLAVLFSGLAFPAFALDKVTVVLDPWPPYSIGETGKEPTGGYFIEVAKEVFNRVGTPAEIMLYPWKRCLQYMQDGEKDVLLGVTKTAEREQFMAYTDAVVVDRVVFFYNKEKFPEGFSWNSFEELKEKNLRIGVTAGYNYGEEFSKAEKELGLKTDPAEGETKNFEKLILGRTDIFICYEISGKFWVNENAELKEKIGMAEKPVLAELPFYLAISKKSAAVDLIPKINESIAAMNTDGTMAKLLGK